MKRAYLKNWLYTDGASNWYQHFLPIQNGFTLLVPDSIFDVLRFLRVLLWEKIPGKREG